MDPKPELLYHLLQNVATSFPSKQSFLKRDKVQGFVGISFSKLKENVDQLTAGWISIGLKPGDRVGFFCDASTNWLSMDLSILSAGGVVVPRGTDIVDDEILYILNHSEAKFLVVQKQKDYQRIINLKSQLPKLEFLVILE